MLGDIYNCNIVLGSPQLAHCQLTVTFENESLDKVLDVIAATFNLKVVKNGSTILLVGESCGN
jgi:ferric-dicitrate binding protein FerR (iron transport regulator)